MTFVRDTLTTFSAQIASMLLGIAATIVIARVLGPSGSGAYYYYRNSDYYGEGDGEKKGGHRRSSGGKGLGGVLRRFTGK